MAVRLRAGKCSINRCILVLAFESCSNSGGNLVACIVHCVVLRNVLRIVLCIVLCVVHCIVVCIVLYCPASGNVALDRLSVRCYVVLKTKQGSRKLER